MLEDPRLLYLDLMKKTLSFTLWPEPPVPIEVFNYRRAPWKRKIVTKVVAELEKRHLQLVRPSRHSEEDRVEGHLWPVCADTMIGHKRLDQLQEAVTTVIEEKIPGDLIETGVWRGGACIFMRAILAAYGVSDRKVYVADSFEGLPPPDTDTYPEDAGDVHHTHGSFLAVSKEQVEENFRRYGMLDDNVVFLKGWFNETLPKADIQQLAILRMDGDMYGSTMDVFNSLYDKLVPGGFCIIDDYALDGCRKAVDDFRQRNGITAETHQADWSGIHWRK